MARLSEYLVKRGAYAAFTLLAVSILVFVMTQLLPGNAAELLLGQFATEESVRVLERDLGLNRPVHVQYLDWMYGIITGDWGTSYSWGQPVTELVVPRTINSLYLTAGGMVLMTTLGVSLGVLAALKPGGKLDIAISSGMYVGVSVPDFVTATALILLGSAYLNLFPAAGFVPPGESLVGFLHHVTLPIVTLTIFATAHVMRQTRSGMVETLQSEYVRSAHLKGLRTRTVVVKHALRNGILPAITVIAYSFGWMMGGLVIVETVYAYPGIGRLAVDAIKNRDIPIIQATMLVLAAMFIVANTAADVLYAKLNPRIDYGE